MEENANINTAKKINYAEIFKFGKTYEFYIESEEKTASGKGFFNLHSKDYGTVHKFYFNGTHKASPGEDISLTVVNINTFGQLILTEPENHFEFSNAELKYLKKVDDFSFERETQTLEFKSSFVYSCGGITDIDVQLGTEIIHQIAAMLNTNGGEIKVGYSNSGRVCGINKDMPYLNSSRRDSRNYIKSLDGLELKIRNTIMDKLGKYAASLVNVEFCKTANNLVVMILKVQAAENPVFVGGHYIYVKSGNTCINLSGSDITEFIRKKCKNNNNITEEKNNMNENEVAELGNVETAVETIVENETMTEKETAVEAVIEEADAAAPSCYITLFNNGEVSRQNYKIENSAVLHNIPLTFTQICNPDSRLIITYENGHCTFLHPYEILTEKLREQGRSYANGWNKNSKIINILLCNVNDYLFVRSKRVLDSQEMLKAVAVSKYRTYGGTSMHAQGHRITDKLCVTPFQYGIVKNENFDQIEGVFMRAGYTGGRLATHAKAANASAYISSL